jgi:hypothetical protein
MLHMRLDRTQLVPVASGQGGPVRSGQSLSSRSLTKGLVVIQLVDCFIYIYTIMLYMRLDSTQLAPVASGLGDPVRSGPYLAAR